MIDLFHKIIIIIFMNFSQLTTNDEEPANVLAAASRKSRILLQR